MAAEASRHTGNIAEDLEEKIVSAHAAQRTSPNEEKL